jgi:hypothetical protein
LRAVTSSFERRHARSVCGPTGSIESPIRGNAQREPRVRCLTA